VEPRKEDGKWPSIIRTDWTECIVIPKYIKIMLLILKFYSIL